MSDAYDLIVIGAGMAGTSAANKCAAQGWRVAIVDELPYGGTCALRGCDPKKILRRGAEIVDAARLLDGDGIQYGETSIDWSDLVRRKRRFTERIPAALEQELIGNNVATLHGQAQFVGRQEVRIDDRVYTSKKFLVATGARPRTLEFPGAEHVIDSTSFLDLDRLPKRIVFVGGGFISFEFAHIAARAGAECIILDHGPRPLRGFDEELVRRLVRRSEQAGISVLRNTSVDRVEPRQAGFVVLVATDGTTSTIDADLVVHGAGRVAALDDLDLKAAEVAYGSRGVTVADHLQSPTNPAVFAAGDAADTAGRPLTPVAVFEGKVAASNMLRGTTTAPDYTGVPTTVFSIPELNRVGLLEDEARAQGFDVDVRFTDTSDWYSSYRVGETESAAKIVIDTATDMVLGAHLLGHGYSELINTFGMAMKLGLTTRQLKAVTATYPSLGSDLGSML